LNKIISTVLLVSGIVFIILGISAMDSFSSDVSRLFDGTPSDKSIWMIVGGVIAVILGTSGALFSPKSEK